MENYSIVWKSDKLMLYGKYKYLQQRSVNTILVTTLFPYLQKSNRIAMTDTEATVY